MMTAQVAETRTRELWNALKTGPIFAQALRALEAGVPPAWYPYHNVGHAEDVAIEVLALAIYDGLPTRELELLALAATYHDIGFLFRYEKNEAFAASIVDTAMRDYGGYTGDAIVTVKAAIMATVVRPHPAGGIMQSVADGDVLAGYLADADLGNFGNNTFFAQSESVWRELILHGKIPNDTPEARTAFNKFSLSMLKNHVYYTGAARAIRLPRKMKNLATLEAEMT